MTDLDRASCVGAVHALTLAASLLLALAPDAALAVAGGAPPIPVELVKKLDVPPGGSTMHETTGPIDVLAAPRPGAKLLSWRPTIILSAQRQLS